MALETLSDRFGLALGQMTENFVSGLADFIIVLIFLGIGYIVAKTLSKIVERGLLEMKLEQKLKQKNLQDALVGFKLTEIIRTFVKLAAFSVFLGIAANVTKLEFLNNLTWWFLTYLPSLMQGVIIMVIALFGADYIANRLEKAPDLPFPRLLALSTKVFVGYTALVIALPLVLPSADVSILRTFFQLIVGGFALAFGLGSAIAIGLGMKDTIASVSKKKEREFEKILG